ncbi:MAG: SAM-dependent methyltransferase [Candidatus Omnitrophica bacterium CG11_big_fil_rev_8_21_14_0_20_45_26]|uniref:SAM-dependent methyltransferase n=1 Tax=Candidatus Abzuiibacterium crystallinum TaxID=1974748 RepID=A0A2H0LR29_9BACT|nr:MAG: SAM-dependent methyltransferase [Candidatus Omnitrophica bacterium CG11_big_fil_rev_8_21_14_0_20_45_26]PIW64668.1 MAG: SAM-dependent methyltransferase [Candidatus Omnitrophica bacterium CG12_big_fil_rev_8_21_14_0_65_45_16]
MTEELKQQIRLFWDRYPCAADRSNQERYSKTYFEELAQKRYLIEPEIISFAQFDHYRGRDVLEVGVGPGHDFRQWVAAGANAYGIDFSSEAIHHTTAYLQHFGLNAKEIKIGDAENLPYPADRFDLVYSWGVLHHTPDTQKALSEIVRVCQPGGICKVMFYHRNSLYAFYLWLKYALLKGRPWQSFGWCIGHFLESPGTQAFSVTEVRKMLNRLPVQIIKISPTLTYYDLLKNRSAPIRAFAWLLSFLLGGNRVGWFMLIEFQKKN